MKAITMLLAAVLLTACTMPAAPPPLPTVAPTPDPATAFYTAYAEAQAARQALGAALDSLDPDAGLGDAAQRARIGELAADWRTAINAIRYLDQPDGDKWDRAWPRIVDAMAEYAYLASLIESAARDNNVFILYQGSGRAEAAMALLDEAMGIVEGE